MSRLQLYSTATAAALVLVMLPGTALAELSSSELEDAAPVMTMPLTDSEGTPIETATALVDDPSAAHSPDEDAATQSDSALAQTTEAPESGTSEGGPIAILTEPLSVDNDFLVAGVTWGPDQQLAADSEISIRVREDGQWSDWYPMGSDGSGRDDGVGRPATEPFITGGADAVQVQVTGEAVDLPADLAVTMVPGNPQGEVTLDPDDVTPAPADPTPQAQVDEDSDTDETVPQETSSDGGATVDQSTESGTIPSDQSSTDGPSSGSGGSIGSGGTGVRDTRALLTSVAAASTAKDLPVNVITRAQWGANESYMTWDPEEATAPFVIVHHTVGTNNYSASQSAGIVNSIYYYHAVTLDWGDIGYNFLVDKYGQVFEGRAGSASATPGKMVAGAHAQGANTGTMGIAMMGTYTTESPTSAELTAVGKMAGWQLSRAGVDPRGSARFTITYDNGKYQKGETLTLNRILGHRDVYATECPGNIGYTTLGTIRSIASTVSVVNNPQGVVDEVSADSATGTLTVRGWAFDKDTTSPIGVHIYVDGTFLKAITADRSRPDVKGAYGLTYDTVGFNTTFTATPGTHNVCLYAINVGGGSNQTLSCANATLTTVMPSAPPIGNVELVEADSAAQTIQAIGWAFDKDTTSPIGVHIYVDGTFLKAITADRSRPDVKGAYGLTYDTVGFNTTFTATPGTHNVCLYAINVGGGSNQTLACNTTTITSTNPKGIVDSVTADPATQTITARGWAVDWDTTSPIGVHIYVDGTFLKAITADRSRPDVKGAYGLTYDTVGFNTTFTATPGTHNVCLYAINVGGGSNQTLACNTTTITSTSVFTAGDIISDAVMFNSSAMTAASVQSFLSSMNGSCRPASDGTKCLKDYTVTTSTMTFPYCTAYTGDTAETAAAIISKSATACRINPQTLIVMLQKEQGLVTATGQGLLTPTGQPKYDRALGLGCPDNSTGCDASKAGFQIQVYGAASRLVQYGEEPAKFRFRAGQTTAIAYHPNASCGSSAVTLANRATAALYNYTPYQPNEAALAHMYGTGDDCSSYGNRNFWRIFTDWFGSTH